MAETKRVIYYDQLSGNQPTNGDVIFVDNPTTGTHKMDLKSFVDAINNGFDSSIKSSGVSVSADNYSSIITNVNDQPVNSVYTYGAGLQSKVSNLPSNKAMTIVNFAQKSTGGLGQVMLAVERNGSDDYLHFRTIGGSPAVWSSWVKVANNSDVEAVREALDNLDVETDKSLSIDGKPADAKKVGDEISDIKADLSDLGGAVFEKTDNLLDFGYEGGMWIQGWVGNTNLYQAHSGHIPVDSGKTIYAVISPTKFEELYGYPVFQLMIDVYDANEAILKEQAIKVTLGGNTGHYDLPSDASYIVVRLTTTQFGKNITVDSLNHADGIAYVGYSNVTKNSIYPNYKPKTESLENEIENTNARIAVVASGIADVKSILLPNNAEFSPIYEMGNITIGSNGWTYSNSTSRVRTKEGTTIYLSEGDKIILNDNTVRYYIGWLRADGTYKGKGWLNADYEITENGNYVILLSLVQEATVTVDRLKDALSFDKQSLYQNIALDKADLSTLKTNLIATNNIIKCIGHRGDDINAPENTLIAFKYAKDIGYKYVETDVRFTSDGVAVLLHDATIDRTSNGTGEIAQLTYDQVKDLDFGSWFSTTFSGEKIPTFEQFIKVCRRLGLKPYVEIKAGTTEQINGLVDTVLKYGMGAYTTWVDYNSGRLTTVKDRYSKARIGLIITPSNFNASTISILSPLKTTDNEVFVDFDSYSATTNTVINDNITALVANDIAAETVINGNYTIVGANPYITGMTTDAQVVERYMYELWRHKI